MIPSVGLWTAGLVLALLLGAVWLLRRKGSAERRSRPPELARADLVYMEQTFRTGGPLWMVAKVDRVYRLPDGVLVLVELKTRRRDRPYLTDIIQLSVQRLAVAAQTGASVEPYAFVSVLDTAGRLRSHRVHLLDLNEISDLRRRRKGILDGQLRPAYATSEAPCRQCALRHKCDRPRLS